jgi:hypothetical protein
MSWECGYCGSVEGIDGVMIEAVCHHCGKPLCRLHRLEFLDEVFGQEPGPLGSHAYHCSDCKKAYHARAAIIEKA